LLCEREHRLAIRFSGFWLSRDALALLGKACGHALGDDIARLCCRGLGRAFWRSALWNQFVIH
jgi:hypothetical protein